MGIVACDCHLVDAAERVLSVARSPLSDRHGLRQARQLILVALSVREVLIFRAGRCCGSNSRFCAGIRLGTSISFCCWLRRSVSCWTRICTARYPWSAGNLPALGTLRRAIVGLRIVNLIIVLGRFKCLIFKWQELRDLFIVCEWLLDGHVKSSEQCNW